MWIVRIALKRPYTFVVLAMLIVIMGVVTLASMALIWLRLRPNGAEVTALPESARPLEQAY